MKEKLKITPRPPRRTIQNNASSWQVGLSHNTIPHQTRLYNAPPSETKKQTKELPSKTRRQNTVSISINATSSENRRNDKVISSDTRTQVNFPSSQTRRERYIPSLENRRQVYDPLAQTKRQTDITSANVISETRRKSKGISSRSSEDHPISSPVEFSLDTISKEISEDVRKLSTKEILLMILYSMKKMNENMNDMNKKMDSMDANIQNILSKFSTSNSISNSLKDSLEKNPPYKREKRK